MHRRIPRFAAMVSALICASLHLVGEVAAETWAERLGYPAGSKVLVLHANELGMCYETNASGTRLLESGPVRSAGAMVPGPWFGDLAQWCKSHPDADVGLELTLNSEHESYRWQPVAGGGIVPSLVDADGFLWRTPVQTMVNGSAEDVERELRAQIARAKTAGLQPSHLTTHLGTLVTRPDLIEVYLRVARQEWIPAMIVELTPQQIERFQRLGFPLPDDVIQLLSDYPLPKVDDLQWIADADSYAAKKQAFLELLGKMEPGITQIAFHPATASDALSRITPDAEQRVWDAELMADDEVQQALRTEGIVLTDWREIMRRFEGRPSPTENQAQ
jgi:predicted glycoside hydrolase/deacetylase ChbG (UPF0249 family)